MKRCCFSLLLLVLCYLMTGCALLAAGSHNSEPEIAGEMFSRIARACKDQDADALAQLFSPNALADTEDFAADAQALFDLFDGNVAAIADWAGPMSEGSSQDGESWKMIQSSVDFQTWDQDLRLAMLICTQNTKAPENVGLQSLYLIRAEDSDLEIAYWGGWEWLPGIHVQESE